MVCLCIFDILVLAHDNSALIIVQEKQTYLHHLSFLQVEASSWRVLGNVGKFSKRCWSLIGQPRRQEVQAMKMDIDLLKHEIEMNRSRRPIRTRKTPRSSSLFPLLVHSPVECLRQH